MTLSSSAGFYTTYSIFIVVVASLNARLQIESEWGRAIADFERCLKAQERNVRCLLAKGLALFELKRFKDTNRVYTNVLRLEPDNSVALCNRGLISGRFLCRYKEAPKQLATEIPRGSKNIC